MSSPQTFADLLAAIRPRERSVRVLVDGQLLAQREELAARVLASDGGNSLAGDPELPALLKDLADLDERIADAVVTFRMRAIGRNSYRRLVAEHPSSDEDRLWDVDTFPPALVAACAVEPVIRQQDVALLVEVLSPGQFDELFSAAFRACNEADSIPFTGPVSQPIPD